MECGSNLCYGSVVNRPAAKKPRKHQKEASEVWSEATEFIDEFYKANNK